VPKTSPYTTDADARCSSSARGNAARRSAARAPTTSASAGTSQSKDCPIAWGTRASPIGRSVGSQPRVRKPPQPRRRAASRNRAGCSRVSGLFTQSRWTAGPDGVREPRPHHSSGIDVPMKRQVSLGSVGSTDCAITRHYFSRKLQRRCRG